MAQHASSPGIVTRPMPDAIPGVTPAAGLALPPLRCADGARLRGEPLAASAVRYRRFLLLEVPGPWGRSALDGTHVDPDVARQLGEAASAAGANVLLIRRPGRHPAAGPGTHQRAWALADASPGAERVQWGTWRDPADLLTVDLSADIPAEATQTGPQRLALACTNGKRDQCCAIRGRPVADAIAATAGWDTWECSHLGGHRFAATIMLLPFGDMFGRLDPESALEVVRRFDAGQLVLSHYRGRAGQPVPVQAALHAAAVRLGDFRRDAVQVRSACPAAAPGAGRHEQPPEDDADLWQVEITHRADDGPEAAYSMILAGSRLAPAFLSCLDSNPKTETRYEVLTFSRIQ